jgi:transcriptional regulator with XRE-family HTH domain
VPKDSKVISQSQRQMREALGAFVRERLTEEFGKLAKPTPMFEEIARDTGLGVNTIARIWNNGGANLDTLVPLASRLGCTVAEMITPRKPATPLRPGLRPN